MAALVAVLGFLPVAPVGADPEPTVEELEQRAERLHNKVEVLAERYNGLRVQLKDAKRAARVARDDAREQMRLLAQARGEIRQLAATRYMTRRMDPAIEFAIAEDPQLVLDRAAMLHRMSQQDADRLRDLRTALRNAERAQRSAETRADEVAELERELTHKKGRIESLLDRTQRELLERASRLSGPGLPAVAVPGSSKAVQAANYALSQRGKPYVWGAAGPNSYDCSGLTMWAYRQVGINLPHYTGSQYAAGSPVSRNELRVGDLVFFYSDRHHMGMYIGGGKMVHAPYTGTVVRVDPIAGRPWSGAVRIV